MVRRLKCCVTIWPNATMQFDIFPNPLARARRAFPYVVALQSDLSAIGNDRIIAFVVERESVGKVAGRLMPVVEIRQREFVVLMPSITNVPLSELRGPIGNIAVYRDRIVEALDWMFLGI
jgi:toxin CcdB